MKNSIRCLLVIGLVFCASVRSTELSNEKESRNLERRVLKQKLLSMDNHLEAFKLWHDHHNKINHYHVDSEEGLKRYAIFKTNLNKIKERNAVLTEYKLAPGPHTDLTTEEYQKNVINKHNLNSSFHEDSKPLSMMKHLFLQSDNMWENKQKIKAKPINTNNEDWAKYYPVVRDQGKCGSCWSFATMGSIEGRLSKLTGKYEQLSTQYLVDCSTKDNGCEGGFYDTALEFIFEKGLVAEKDYPYKAVKEVCNAKPNKDIKLNRVLYCANQDTNQEFHCDYGLADKCKEFLQWSPVATAIDADSFDFQNYDEGIFTADKCAKINHAVIITHVTDEYVKIRNSWTQEWGEQGYMRIKLNKTNGSCFTLNQCFAAIDDS